MSPRDTTMTEDEVQQALAVISTRLVITTGVLLLVTVGLFLIPLLGPNSRFPVSWFCFGMGLIGGFVSIQQRLRLLSERELRLLAGSWSQAILIPVFGGVFALLLYLMMLSELVSGLLFPAFATPETTGTLSAEEFRSLLLETYPATLQDFAKLGVWCFVAGFSERFLPDIIERTTGLHSPRQPSDDDT